jgi:hypothetical protein
MINGSFPATRIQVPLFERVFGFDLVVSDTLAVAVSYAFTLSDVVDL